MTARLIFSTGSLYLLDTARSFELAAEAGFDGIEIMCDDRFGTRDPHYLGELSARYQLPVLTAHTPFSHRVPGWPDSTPLALIRQTLKLAEQIGAESIVVHTPTWVGQGFLAVGGRTLRFPWSSPFTEVKRWIEADLAAEQARTTVKIAIENMPGKQFMGTLVNPAWWNTIEEWSRIHDHLTLDTTHWGTYGIDPLDAYRAAGSRVAHVHLSNFDGREHRLPHKGYLDLKAFLRALAADDFSGTVSVEVHPDSLEFYDADLLRRNMADSVAFCREYLA
jgi:sugar phosphate isomerase/epimerase